MRRIFVAILLCLAISAGASTVRPPKILIVVAHPDDESCFAATVYRVSRELGGTVDQLVITNGEAGYKYALPAEPIYGRKLTDEKVGRKELPAIRKKELLRAGKILGIRHHFFLDQTDFAYTTDPAEALKKWDRRKIDAELARELSAENYDLVLTLLPTPDTHGHHKAAAIFALDAVAKLPLEKRPLVLGCINRTSKSAIGPFQGLDGYSETRVQQGSELPEFDRRSSFGYENRLNYHIYVSWMMAEHKSQGLFEMEMGKQDDLEVFRLFESEVPDAGKRASRWLSEIVPAK